MSYKHINNSCLKFWLAPAKVIFALGLVFLFHAQPVSAAATDPDSGNVFDILWCAGLKNDAWGNPRQAYLNCKNIAYPITVGCCQAAYYGYFVETDTHYSLHIRVNPPQCSYYTAWDNEASGCTPSPFASKNQGSGDCQTPEVTQGNPINIGVGNKYQVETDYLGSNAFPLFVSRTYNSISGEWQHLPEIQPNGGLTEAKIVRPDGKKLIFSKDPSGNWVADSDVMDVFVSLVDGSGVITGWRYTSLGGQIEEYDAEGKLVSITNRAGIAHTYVHSASSITVTHSQGGVLTYQLNTSGRITGFTTPDNSQYSYGYDVEDRFVSITYPNSGGTRTYHYEDTNFPKALTGITDEKGVRFATWAYDSEGRAISSEHHGTAEKVILDYTYVDDLIDPRVTATNALGKQTTYHLTTVNNVRKVTQVEGHQSTHCAAANKAYTYDANGFLASKTDWLGRLTNFTRNAKGQVLSRTDAVGTPEAGVVTTEWHATLNVPTKVTALGYEVVYSYDTSGNLTSQQVNDLTAP